MRTILLAALLIAPVVACAQEPRASAPDRFARDIAAAEQAAARGDRTDATARARRIVASGEGTTTLTSPELVSMGRAYVLLGVGDANAVRSALRAFDRAAQLDPANLEAQRRAGALFLDKYNAPDARASFEAVLKKAPNDADALLGLARVEEFEGKPTAMTTARKSVEANPRSADALAYIARLHLETEVFDSARGYAQRAVTVDSSNAEAWALLGATAWITGDSASFRKALASATALQPRPSTFYTELADAAVRQRRYAESVRFAQQAVGYDSLDVRALGILGTNQMRLGQMVPGRAALERAFALDAFNLWHKNSLDLLDKMAGFKTVTQGRFQLIAPDEEADLLALYLIPLLEQAYDSLQLRYGYAPPTPVRLEFFRQHADFSVRTLGLTGLGALGVSFGSLLAMDAPSARDRGTFNWGSTSWHELTHAFTLGASAHRVPRWISEGLSVLEERRANVGWGARPSLSWLVAMNSGKVRPISDLTNGFLRPRSADETQHSYFQASMFCEWVERTKGPKAMPAMLVAYRDGLDTPAAMQRVLGLDMAQVDAQFDAWIKQRYAKDLASAQGLTARDSAGSRFMRVMGTAVSMLEANPDSARRLLEEANGLMPEYAADDGPAWYLARVALSQRDTATALAMLQVVTGRDETAWEANLLQANLLEKRGDRAGAIAALERLNWMWPYDIPLHSRVAILAAAVGDKGKTVRERRAVLFARPTDLLDARYELARALAAAGDTAGARRELLQVLEEAPSFEKAQILLLELRKGGTR